MKRVVAMDHAHLYVKITTAPWANLHSELKVTPGDGTLKIKDENRDMLPHDGISAFALLISPHGLHKTIGTAPDPRRCGMAQSGCSAAIGALFFPADGPPTPDVDDTVFLEAPAFAVRVHVRAVPNPKTRWVTRYLLPRQGSPRFSLRGMVSLPTQGPS